VTTTETAPLLVPTSDATPVELAVVESVMGFFKPETFLLLHFYPADGGVHIWSAWTEGAQPLGDAIDQTAIGLGLDCADWLHLADLHKSEVQRGRVRTEVYPLRPIQADLTAGARAPEERRTGLRAVIDFAAADLGQTPRPGLPRWLGFGPTLRLSNKS
jgi:hypothetical protein